MEEAAREGRDSCSDGFLQPIMIPTVVRFELRLGARQNLHQVSSFTPALEIQGGHTSSPFFLVLLLSIP